MERLNLSLIRTDGGTQTRAELSQEAIADYAEALTDGADFPAIVVFHDGEAHWLADGFHRIAAATKIDLLDFPAIIKQGTRRDAVLYSLSANATHGLRRTNADKRRAAETLLADEEWGRWSDREIARRCGVDHKFVGTVRSSLGTVPSERTYLTKHGTIATMDTAAIGKAGEDAPAEWRPDPNIGQEYQPIIRQREAGELVEPDPFVVQANREAAEVARSVPKMGSESNEWFTPGVYMEAVREVLGSIDLDPASNPTANRIVQAARYFTKDDDGLAQPWPGRVFMNPPYGVDEDRRSNVYRWSGYLLEQFDAGVTTEAIVLVNAFTDRDWFHRLAARFPFCLTDHRIEFYRPGEDGELETPDAPRHGQVFFYLGTRPELFAQVFQRFGLVLREWVPAPQAIAS